MKKILKNDYHLYSSPIGDLCIQLKDGLICLLEFTDSPQQETEFLSDNDFNAFQACCSQLSEYFSGTRKEFTFKFISEGTQFQKKVWDKLLNIPYSKTISYLDLAKQIGNPNSTRAVASANGRNPISIVIPCHRVIGSNGTLTGYGGGLWRKKWLLEHEYKVISGQQTLF